MVLFHCSYAVGNVYQLGLPQVPDLGGKLLVTTTRKLKKGPFSGVSSTHHDCPSFITVHERTYCKHNYFGYQ